MKRKKDPVLKTITDLKIFLTFILDNLHYSIDEATLLDIAVDNAGDRIFDYMSCLGELVDAGHLLFDEFEGMKYYMISEKGREIASELYDTLDGELRESSLRSVAKYMSLSARHTTVKSFIEKTEEKRFRVSLEAYDRFGDVFKLSLTVNSEAEANQIKRNFETRPDGVYKGILLSATGRVEFLS